jgi:hypothetical protein
LAFSRRIFAYPSNSCYRSRSNGVNILVENILVDIISCPLRILNSSSLVNHMVLLVWDFLQYDSFVLRFKIAIIYARRYLLRAGP